MPVEMCKIMYIFNQYYIDHDFVYINRYHQHINVTTNKRMLPSTFLVQVMMLLLTQCDVTTNILKFDMHFIPYYE